ARAADQRIADDLDERDVVEAEMLGWPDQDLVGGGQAAHPGARSLGAAERVEQVVLPGRVRGDDDLVHVVPLTERGEVVAGDEERHVLEGAGGGGPGPRPR